MAQREPQSFILLPAVVTPLQQPATFSQSNLFPTQLANAFLQLSHPVKVLYICPRSSPLVDLLMSPFQTSLKEVTADMSAQNQLIRQITPFTPNLLTTWIGTYYPPLSKITILQLIQLNENYSACALRSHRSNKRVHSENKIHVWLGVVM